MVTPNKQPGVYITEMTAFPNSIIEVATAVPAFIGYTEKAEYKGQDLRNKPWRIDSMTEYVACFGGPPPITFRVTATAQSGETKAFTANLSSSGGRVIGQDYYVHPSTEPNQWFLLYASMALFFLDGGGTCYIVSVGSYDKVIEAADLTNGIESIKKEPEPTMIVVPDAVRLADIDAFTGVQHAALMQCGTLRDRFAVLDIYDGFKELQADPVKNFRDKIPMNHLEYGAVYYPWLETSVLGDDIITTAYIDENDLEAMLTAEGVTSAAALNSIDSPALLNSTLLSKSPAVQQAMVEIKRQLNCLPPSAAIAGIYSMVDNTRGVWKAPANVALNHVVSPSVSISDEDQQDLNIDPNGGKSVNAIRAFMGEGVLVWGARTLDGNSLDWRYVSVRRTMIMLEQSIILAVKVYVFENNVSSTWESIRSMIRSFLTGFWKRGGLAGATADDAFQVQCGLGETMTAQDILDGLMRVTVRVALTRPAEFIEFTLEQQMQGS